MSLKSQKIDKKATSAITLLPRRTQTQSRTFPILPPLPYTQSRKTRQVPPHPELIPPPLRQTNPLHQCCATFRRLPMHLGNLPHGMLPNQGLTPWLSSSDPRHRRGIPHHPTARKSVAWSCRTYRKPNRTVRFKHQQLFRRRNRRRTLRPIRRRPRRHTACKRNRPHPKMGQRLPLHQNP